MVGMTIALIILLVVILLGFAIVKIYNNLVRLRNRVENAWGQIEVQLKRRADLIPNLVNTVKGYASHESQTLTDVIEARQAVVIAESPDEVMKANNILTDTLRQLFAVSEQYPDLKANENFLELSRELSDTEDRISHMRQSYNDTVTMFNDAVLTFPSSIVASIFNFQKHPLFEVEVASDREAPVVQF